MVQRIKPTTQTKIKVVPRDGALEITLNINVTVDGNVTASASNADVVTQLQNKEKEDEDKVERILPDFSTGLKLNDFGK